MFKPYDELTDDERIERRYWAAYAMRKIPPQTRKELIESSSNVLDAQERFLHRMRQVSIARAYRKPKKPDGAA
ncbi:MAG: hypothetical protein KGL39_48890 [Patescibacteria group bacterium]|nr:hypothetical protein [Patescibacteria group bacterium]